MSRRAIIAILIFLILGVVGGAIAFAVSQLRGETGQNTADSDQALQTGELPDAETGVVVTPQADDDNDGLSNALEFLWQTDPNNPDTDGDGTNDGDEVEQNRNPTIAGPNDALPENFQPQQNVAPLPEAGPLQADSFLADDLELSGENKNYSDDYQGEYASGSRNADTLAAYVQEQPIVRQLPRVSDRTITVDVNAGPLTLGEYLRAADGRALLSDQERLLSALGELYGANDISGVSTYALRVRLFEDEALQLSVPEVAVEYHKVLLGYTALKAGSLDMLIEWPQDPVRAMVGLRQLENADRQYLPLLDREFRRLEVLATPNQ